MKFSFYNLSSAYANMSAIFYYIEYYDDDMTRTLYNTKHSIAARPNARTYVDMIREYKNETYTKVILYRN